MRSTYFAAHFLPGFGWMPSVTVCTPESWAETLLRSGDDYRLSDSEAEAVALAADLNAALPPEERRAIGEATLARRLVETIPSVESCRRAGTHMVRCTADGACKVCFTE